MRCDTNTHRSIDERTNFAVKITIEYKISIKFIFTWEFTISHLAFLLRSTRHRLCTLLLFIYLSGWRAVWEGARLSQFNFYACSSDVTRRTRARRPFQSFVFWFLRLPAHRRFFFSPIPQSLLGQDNFWLLLCSLAVLHNIILHINWVSDFVLLRANVNKRDALSLPGIVFICDSVRRTPAEGSAKRDSSNIYAQ